MLLEEKEIISKVKSRAASFADLENEDAMVQIFSLCHEKEIEWLT